ncbi:hypothetical protein [Streptomyces sp. NPDC001292]
MFRTLAHTQARDLFLARRHRSIADDAVGLVIEREQLRVDVGAP